MGLRQGFWERALLALLLVNARILLRNQQKKRVMVWLTKRG